MLFPTLSFGLFFLVVFAFTWSTTSNDWRKLVLLIASWIFYGAWDWRFVPLLIISAVMNWGVAALIARSEDARRRKALMLGGVVVNLLMLGFFKYFDFFAEQGGNLLELFGVKQDAALMQVILPVGISFFTFQGISYAVDVYKGRVPAARLLDILLLMSFFPHLVAGPIVRASDLVPQFQEKPKLNRGMVTMGLLLIVWGLFKKAVIASELATAFVDPVFETPAMHGSVDLVLAAYGYAVQIYCDFSAYSDMAIGIAALLGYRFPRNFDRPYRAASLQEFWRRWHISLSRWLRDYLYIDALGGNRGGKTRVYRNLMITMLLGGLWHGAAWTFVIWGGLHGAALCVERWWARSEVTKAWVLPHWAKVALTFHVVVLGWVFFRAASFGDAIAYLGGIFAPATGAMTATPLVVALILFGLAIHALPWDAMQRAAQRLRTLPAPALAIALAATMLVVDAMRYEGVAPFIYFRF
ncbi:MBOAT family protein [Sphingomonas sp. R-74633]|uniref:MBOAT family O-acyltransferase n=1 Tax=Sphingomonas sp. R-74633 TaxID=2751188 RepID=UPI0015D46B7C|nr:MBOAT family protein [Sphingomonas sp. R-74633]NYT42797.1 MBOAT family protein [Sphingomonas sp. R-74633]